MKITDILEEVFELGILKGTARQYKPNSQVESNAGDSDTYQDEKEQSDDTGEMDV